MWNLRPPLPSDESFIYSSWLRSYRDAPAMGGLCNTVYYAQMHAAIEATLKTALVTVACAPDDPEQIYGYAVFEPGILHFVYCKHSLRGNGIGNMLEGAALMNQAGPMEYTCRTRVSGSLLKTRPNYTYNPFKLWTKQL